jgi:hypothetical protein
MLGPGLLINVILISIRLVIPMALVIHIEQIVLSLDTTIISLEKVWTSP